MRELEQTAVYQRRILAAAVQLVRPGGALVFSTCSINPGGQIRGSCHCAQLFVFRFRRGLATSPCTDCVGATIKANAHWTHVCTQSHLPCLFLTT